MKGLTPLKSKDNDNDGVAGEKRRAGNVAKYWEVVIAGPVRIKLEEVGGSHPA